MEEFERVVECVIGRLEGMFGVFVDQVKENSEKLEEGWVCIY